MVALIEKLLQLTVQIQQIPAPTFAEQARAEFVRQQFVAESLSDVFQDAVGNIYARLPGRGKARPLVVSAHLDTVFPAGTSLQVRREANRIYGPGIGDNSLGVAALLGLPWLLRERGIALGGDLWLVANVGEEGLGNLRGMAAVTERFGNVPRAYLILEGLALGHVYHRAIGVQRYRITAQTAGGHSWSDYGQPSAVHELAALITHLASLRLPSQPRTTLNVGVIAGGTSVNTLAAEAWCELDLRSESPHTLSLLIGQVENLIRLANRPGVVIRAEEIGQRPAGEIPVDHPLVRLAEHCLYRQGLDAVLTAGSTDANIPLSQGFPAIVLGITTGGGAHTLNEFIEIQPVNKGMEQILEFIQGCFASEF
jgi:acetylornithine deacetylase/succinyl-diaminopimelate desuccinylase-like protein